MEAVLGAKLKPEAIEVEPVALPRSLVYGVPGMQERRTVAVADIGWQTTQVCIYENLEPVFPRSIPIGGQSLARAVSEALGVDEDAADQTLREQGSVDLEALEALSRPAPPPEEETQIGLESPFAAGGFESPFAVPQPPAAEPPAAEEPGVPPPIGFDLGDEFVLPRPRLHSLSTKRRRLRPEASSIWTSRSEFRRKNRRSRCSTWKRWRSPGRPRSLPQRPARTAARRWERPSLRCWWIWRRS